MIMRVRKYSSFGLLHTTALGAGALTRAVNSHRHANERIVLLAKNWYSDMQNTFCDRYRVELLCSPDHCTIPVAEVNFLDDDDCPLHIRLAGRSLVDS